MTSKYACYKLVPSMVDNEIVNLRFIHRPSNDWSLGVPRWMRNVTITKYSVMPCSQRKHSVLGHSWFNEWGRSNPRAFVYAKRLTSNDRPRELAYKLSLAFRRLPNARCRDVRIAASQNKKVQEAAVKISKNHLG